MNMLLKKQILPSIGIALLTLSGCAPQPAPDTRAADEAAIREGEVAWSKTAEAKDLAGFVTFYADDAVGMPPNAPSATGPGPIKAALTEMFNLPGFALSFKTTKVEVARSGDIAYSFGTYTMTVNDAKGKPVTDKGKYLTTWRKNAEGKWKSSADMFNTDMPLPAPPAK